MFRHWKDEDLVKLANNLFHQYKAHHEAGNTSRADRLWELNLFAALELDTRGHS